MLDRSKELARIVTRANEFRQNKASRIREIEKKQQALNSEIAKRVNNKVAKMAKAKKSFGKEEQEKYRNTLSETKAFLLLSNELSELKSPESREIQNARLELVAINKQLARIEVGKRSTNKYFFS